MPRLRLLDYRLSRGPHACGLLETDLFRVAELVNSAQRRLLLAKESGDEGWYGTWAEMHFTVSRSGPFITLPRGVARIEASTICDRPVWIQNQFYEYLDFGNGTLPKRFRCQCGSFLQGYQRNNAITFTDLTPGRRVACFATSDTDEGKEVLIQGIDAATGEPVRSQVGTSVSDGELVVLAGPGKFVTTNTTFTRLTGIQKDPTDSTVQFVEVDPTTGDQTLIHIMDPSETVAGYPRYYFDRLPSDCCVGFNTSTCNVATVSQNLQVKAIVKMDLVPALVDTDYLIIQNLEALISESQAVRYSEMDTPASKNFMAVHHRDAIRFLQGELVHFLGAQRPAINFSPFGTAKLSHQKIGSLI